MICFHLVAWTKKKKIFSRCDLQIHFFNYLQTDHLGIRRKSTGGMATGRSAATAPPVTSPYDNVSLAQSLSESVSIDLDFTTTSANTSRASSRCLEESPPPVQLPVQPSTSATAAATTAHGSLRARQQKSDNEKRISSLSGSAEYYVVT